MALQTPRKLAWVPLRSSNQYVQRGLPPSRMTKQVERARYTAYYDHGEAREILIRRSGNPSPREQLLAL